VRRAIRGEVVTGHAKAGAGDLVDRNARRVASLYKRLLQRSRQSVVTDILMIAACRSAETNAAATFICDQGVRLGCADIDA
jgi:hypothetical protein